MTRTIAVSDSVFEDLKRLKEGLSMPSYSALLEYLVREYAKARLARLVKLAEELKLSEEEVEELKAVIEGLRRREWW